MIDSKSKDKLREKGWAQHEINKTGKIFHHIKQSHVEVRDKIDRFIYITSLIVLLMCNFLGVLILVPLFIILSGKELYVIIGLFGILFGFLFNFLIHSIEHLGDKHHIIAGVVVPLIAVLDIFLLIKLIRNVGERFNLDVVYNPIINIVLFVAVFLIPYLIDVFRGKHKF